jgi:hypothetical protein
MVFESQGRIAARIRYRGVKDYYKYINDPRILLLKCHLGYAFSSRDRIEKMYFQSRRLEFDFLVTYNRET